MSYSVVGTCSLCGGMVTVPTVWFGVAPPIPICQQCGAHAAAHGPVIPMRHNSDVINTKTENICNTSADLPKGKTFLVD